MDVLTEIEEYTAAVPIPEDTIDEIDATTVVQGLQAVANRTKYLLAKMAMGADSWTYDNTSTPPFINTTWSSATFGVGTLADGTLPSITIAGCRAGDLVLVRFTGHFASTALAGDPHEVRLNVLEDGASVATYCRTIVNSGVAGTVERVTMIATHEINADCSFNVRVEGKISTDPSERLHLKWLARMEAILMRQS